DFVLAGGRRAELVERPLPGYFGLVDRAPRTRGSWRYSRTGRPALGAEPLLFPERGTASPANRNDAGAEPGISLPGGIGCRSREQRVVGSRNAGQRCAAESAEPFIVVGRMTTDGTRTLGKVGPVGGEPTLTAGQIRARNLGIATTAASEWSVGHAAESRV